MLKKLKKAFTITELVIVIAVIAILAAVLIPTFTHVVNNAKVSSAMQTCRNALTDYLALVGGDDDPDNDDATGMVFVSDGYAFVYLNSALQQIGEVDDLAVIHNGDTDISNLKTNGIDFSGIIASKSLTVDEIPEDLADVADSVTEQLIAGMNLNETDAAVSEVLAETAGSRPQVNPLASAVESIVAEKEEEADEFDEEQAEEERRERLMKEMLEARKKKVFARKMPKRLPKFMLRPVPEEPEGIMYENFRMFIKWALLYNAQLKRQEYLPKMECVAVNLPAEYAFLIDKANAEEEKSELPFEYLGDLGNENVGGNLDLVGALYTGIYNKRQNF
ncbi:hypothetical protein AV274_5117 [Blastocystis sp. ATCC 50177/Nand II]|uniref:Prepilin-type N-terminal cleavage/methylation domain-containing protein n=1 Tax=Blastocystis sp. subtype 1 (strain ATCC 50177 / NandII) TaxID=478820 RepID=A0A196S827_BLAHN|nr:hypothetical protein AV274_5117 [Blastocystis sp. ATCC 50177/Nand II]